MSTEHRPVSMALARYRRLPRRSSSIWQGGIVRVPAWIESPHGAPPWRPWASVWIAGPDGVIHMNTSQSSDRPDAAFAADVIVELALKHQNKLAGRPGCIQVVDAAFGRAIVDYLGDPEVRIEVVPAIDVVDHVSHRVHDHRSHEHVHEEITRFLREGQFSSIEAANAAIAEQFTGQRLDHVASTATTPIERAQDLAYRAFDAVGRRRVILAREALAASPDCADAYVVLAEQAAGPGRALPLYEQGVAAGEHALGPDGFGENTGHFWSTLDTRPYMRARMGLAQTLLELGRVDEAIEHHKDLLRLNPNDNQGVRYVLLLSYVVTGRDADAVELLTRYQDDPTAEWMYTRALVNHRMGMTVQATAALAAARGVNPFVAQYLVDPDAESPESHPLGLTIGGLDEAAEYAEVYGEVWRASPGAMEWIRQDERGRKKTRRGEARRKAAARHRPH